MHRRSFGMAETIGCMESAWEPEEKSQVAIRLRSDQALNYAAPCFVSGHDFSRVAKDKRELGFSPCEDASRTKCWSRDNFQQGTVCCFEGNASSAAKAGLITKHVRTA
jgi:hypothetical protein